MAGLKIHGGGAEDWIEHGDRCAVDVRNAETPASVIDGEGIPSMGWSELKCS